MGDKLETFQYLAYLLTWLDERETALGPETHGWLRDDAQSQLDTVRDALGLVPALPLRAPEEIAPELNLVQAVFKQIWSWSGARVITDTSARSLRQYLIIRADDLQAELADRPVEIELPSDLQVLDYAIESLPSWGRDIPLRAVTIAALRDHLSARRAALLQDIIRELTLVQAALKQAMRWARTAKIGPNSASKLRQYL